VLWLKTCARNMALLPSFSTLAFVVLAVVAVANGLEVKVLVKNGNSYSNCDFWTADDSVWAVSVNGNSPEFYRSSGYNWCGLHDNNLPRYQYSSSFSCSNQITRVHVCFYAGDDNTLGVSCALSEGIDSLSDLACLKSSCVMNYLPACTGGDCSLTIPKQISVRGSNGIRGFVNYNIERRGNCPTAAPTQSTFSPSGSPSTSSPTEFPSHSPTIACGNVGERCGRDDYCCVNGTYCNSVNQTLSICERLNIGTQRQSAQSDGASNGMSDGMLILVLFLFSIFLALFICVAGYKIYILPTKKENVKHIADKNEEALDQQEGEHGNEKELYDETIGDSTPVEFRITSA